MEQKTTACELPTRVGLQDMPSATGCCLKPGRATSLLQH
jgi:hypothetical protein